MHSGLILFFWLAGIVLLQQLSGVPLAGMALISLLLAGWVARSRIVRLLRRIRFFLLAIFVFFAWFTPGEALLVSLPAVSPTREGLQLSLSHAGRLIVTVCWVAILLQAMSLERLVSGVYALCRPLAVFGFSAERLAVRLVLTLRYIEHDTDSRRMGRYKDFRQSGWKAWFVDLETENDRVEKAASIQVYRERFSRWDKGMMAGGVLLIVMSVMF